MAKCKEPQHVFLQEIKF